MGWRTVWSICGGITIFLKEYGRRLNAFKQTIRLENCLMGGLIVFIGAFVVHNLDLIDYLPEIIPAVLAAFFLMAGGNMMNDVADASIDRIVHPSRAIPRGIFTKRFIAAWAVVFYCLALLFALLINLRCFLFALGGMAVLSIYELRLKKDPLIGNVAIAFLVGCVFLGTAAAVGGWAELILLSVLAFLINVAREILKDVEDVRGDEGRQTLPKKIGIDNALHISYGILVMTVLLSVLPWYPYRIFRGSFYPIFITVADGIIIYGIYISKRDAKRSQQSLKFAMLMALISFLVGGMG